MFDIIFVLIGTFVGAGFASGKEIFNFFTIFNLYSFVSIFAFSLLLFFLIFKCINIKKNNNLNSYSDFLLYLEKKYKYFNSKFFLFIINIFLASSFYIMIIALAALFNYQFNIEKYIVVFISIFICFNIFYNKNIDFIYIINRILMPILILFMLLLCYFNINIDNIFSVSLTTNNYSILYAITIGLIYFSYNSLLLIPIVFDLKINYNKSNISFKISFIYSLIIFILIFFINLLLLCFYSSIYNIELPILYICNNSFKIFLYFYFFIVLSAIFTTMISSGYTFVNNFKEKNYTLKLLIFLLFSFIFCFFSFSDLINFFYPIFGIIGFIQIFLILFNRY
jgi:uncharacterized membrane protein YkvI